MNVFNKSNKSIKFNKGPCFLSVIIILVTLFTSGCDQVVDIELGKESIFARPGTPSKTIQKGYSKLGLGGSRDGFIYVPQNYKVEDSIPLLVVLHGSNGSSADWSGFTAWAEEKNCVLLAIDSRSATWDLIIAGGYGIDVEFIDEALKYTFDRCKIDPSKLALCGFSDGASYTLSLGSSNGELFSHLIAYSPGFFTKTEPLFGRPKVFISHGISDSFLPLYVTKEQIVPTFKELGYAVTFEEFEGAHEVPESVIYYSLNEWFLEIPQSGG